MADIVSTSDQGRTVTLLSASGFVASINQRSMDLLLPKLAEEFSVTVGQAANVIVAYAIGYGVCQLAVGAFGDRIGKFRLIIGLCLASALATALCAAMASIGQLTLARLAAGAASSGIVPMAMAWIGDKVAIGNRQAVMAKYMGGTIAGALLGQVIGGILADHFGWRVTTLIVSLGFVAVALALMLQARKAPDVLARPYDGSAGPNLSFLLRSLRSNPLAHAVLAGVAIEGIALFGTLAFVGAMLHAQFGISLGWVGAVLAFFGLGGIVYTFLVPTLLGRFNASFLLAAGGFLIAAGMLIVGFSPALWSMPVAIGLVGFGFYLIHNPLQFYSTQILPGARGTGVAIFATVLFLAQSLGVAVLAPAVDWWGMQPVCIASAAGMILGGLWLSVKLPGAAKAAEGS